MQRLTVYIIMLLAVIFASCSDDTKQYKIGVSQNSFDVWRMKQNNEMKMTAFSEGEVELCFANSYNNKETQSRQIDSLVNLGVNLLIVCPDAVSDVQDAIDRAYGRGVPIIVYDKKVNSKKYTAFIGPDNYTMGYNMGCYIAQRLGGKGRIVEIMGLRGSTPTIERHRGFTDAIGKYPDITIVETLDGNWTKGVAYNQTKEKLATIATADAVFAANDLMAVGARNALNDAGVLKKKHILFCGIDGLPGEDGGIKMVCDSILDATYINPTFGDKLIELAMKILKGKEYKREQYMSSLIVTSENANLLYMQNLEVDNQMEYLRDLQSREIKTLRLLDDQRVYLLVVALIALLLSAACGYAYYAYAAKSKYSKKLKESYDKQLKLTHEVEQLTDAQLSFYTHVSHELRTPLTLMADPVERLLDSKDVKGENRQLVETLSRSVTSLMNLVNDILDFRNIDDGKAVLHLSRFNFAEALTHWTEMVEDIMRKKYISIKLDTQEAEGEIIVADYDKMGKLYLNLLQIAVRYNMPGTMLSFKLTKNGDTFMLRCVNGGIPFEDRDIEELFMRFKYKKGMTGGTAISLANIKGVTDLHHGTIKATSLDNTGVELLFTFPATQPEALENNDIETIDERQDKDYAIRLALEPYANSDVAGKRNVENLTAEKTENKPVLLVVDDNTEIRNYVKSIMKAQYTVIEASDGRDGISVALKEVPDLIISDVMMPYVDGIEMCRKLRESPVTCHIPIILLTARALDDQQAEGLTNGADAYIKKPFSSKVLIAQADSLLRNRTLQKVRWSNAQPEKAETSKNATQEDAFIQRLRDIINANIADSDFGVEEIGDRMGMSRVQLYRKAKALTGVTPVELLRKARLAKARQMLEAHSGTVAEVAYKVGFSTPSYFSKCFKEEYGILPNEVK